MNNATPNPRPNLRNSDPRYLLSRRANTDGSPLVSLSAQHASEGPAKGDVNTAMAGGDAGNVPQNSGSVVNHRPLVECGVLPFLIRRDGSWLYRGSPIGSKEMVCLFASVLRREADGSYWLQTPAERGQIEVEDVPFLAVELDWVGCDQQQNLTFRTNVDEIVTAGPQHRIRVAHDLLTCEPTPYLAVRPGVTPDAPWIEARMTRAVYYELVALAVPGMVHGRCVLGVWSSGVFFSLGEMPSLTGEA